MCSSSNIQFFLNFQLIRFKLQVYLSLITAELAVVMPTPPFVLDVLDTAGTLGNSDVNFTYQKSHEFMSG